MYCGVHHFQFAKCTRLIESYYLQRESMLMANYATCEKCDNVFAVAKWKAINFCPMCSTVLDMNDIDHDNYTNIHRFNLFDEYTPDDYDSDDFYEKGPLGDLLRYKDDLE